MALDKITTAMITDDAVTAAKIPAGAIGSTEIAEGALSSSALQNTTNHNLTGTYAESRMYTSDAYTLTGDTTVNANLVLSSVKGDDSDITLTTDSTTRTITGTGKLEGGALIPKREVSVTGMTGELGSVVTGSPALNSGSFTGVLPVGVTGGSGLQNGITHASTWHLTSSLTGDALPVTSNLAEMDGVLGSSMTVSSGIFTFPVTGYWLITTSWTFYGTAIQERHAGLLIQVSVNAGSGDTYTEKAHSATSAGNTGSGTQYGHTGSYYIFDVTNPSTHKVRFEVDVVNTNMVSYGHATSGRCAMQFLRLGDT